jgi:hypothetical protein
VTVQWEARSLEAFGDQPLEDGIDHQAQASEAVRVALVGQAGGDAVGVDAVKRRSPTPL